MQLQFGFNQAQIRSVILSSIIIQESKPTLPVACKRHDCQAQKGESWGVDHLHY